MKMADGGWRPAYNAQLVTDTGSQVIVGLDLTNAGTDHGQLGPMVRQLRTRYGRAPGAWLADAGFLASAEIEEFASPKPARPLPPVRTLRSGVATRICRFHRTRPPLPTGALGWARRKRRRSTKTGPPPPSASTPSPAIEACSASASEAGRRPEPCSSGSPWLATSCGQRHCAQRPAPPDARHPGRNVTIATPVAPLRRGPCLDNISMVPLPINFAKA